MRRWAVFVGTLSILVLCSCGRFGFDSAGGEPGETDAGQPGPPPELSFGITVSSANDQRSHAVAGMPNGDIVMAVHGSGDTNFGDQAHIANGQDDIYILRLSRSGEVLWSRHFGGPGRDVTFDLAVDGQGNIFAVGIAGGPIDFGEGIVGDNGAENAFVLSMTGDGTHRWSHVVGDDDDGDTAFGVSVSNDGNVLVTGWLSGEIDFLGDDLSTQGQDAYIATFSPNGQLLSLAQFEGSGLGQGQKVVADTAGNTYLTGVFTEESAIGNSATSAGGRDLFALRVDTNGQLSWAYHGGSTERDDGTRIATDGTQTYVGGQFVSTSLDFGGVPLINRGEEDAFVTAFESNGTPRWSLHVGSIGEDNVHGLLVAPDSTVIVAGRFTNTIELGEFQLTASSGVDTFVAGLNRDGEVLWAQAYGGQANERMLDFARAPDGALLAVGSVSENTDFGGGPTVADGTDAFLLRLVPPQ